MKIAFILPSLANKGPIIVVKDLTEYLIEMGVHCHVYYFDEVAEIEFSCNTERISFFTPIEFDKYDIIHSHMFRPDLYGAFWKRLKKPQSKFVSTIHLSVREDIKYAYGRLKAILTPFLWVRAWRRYDLVVVLTQVAYRIYTELNANSNIVVINNGRTLDSSISIPVEDLMFFNKLRIKDIKIIGSVASFDKRKGLEQIILLLPLYADLNFVVVGDGNEKDSLIALATKLNVADRCHFLGTRPNGYLYMKYFDFYALPSRSEGLPLALIEAVISKVPVICSSLEVFVEIFSEKEVFYFDLDNLDSLQIAFDNAFNNGMERAQIAYLRYLKSYTLNVMASNYLINYKGLIYKSVND